MSYFTEFAKSEDDEWDQETGAPSIGLFGRALQCWSVCQARERVTVAEAAAAFNVEPRLIIEAAEDHYWMFLTGPRDDYTKLIIEHEGE